MCHKRLECQNSTSRNSIRAGTRLSDIDTFTMISSVINVFEIYTSAQGRVFRIEGALEVRHFFLATGVLPIGVVI
ncbi:hypothetical protein MHYP_G00225330 [Metynnis hypsauchen]